MRHLRRHGHHVIVIDESASRDPTSVPMDVALASADLADPVVGELVGQADTVFHFVESSPSRVTARSKASGTAASLKGSLNVMASCAEHGCELVIATSAAVYGKARFAPLGEDDDAVFGRADCRQWLVGLSQRTIECLALAWHSECGLDVKIVRPFDCIGPKQAGEPGAVVPRLIARALKGEPLILEGDGEETRSFTYIEDFVAGLDIVWRLGRPGEVYNIGAEEEVSIKQLAHKILALTRSPSEIQYAPVAEAAVHDVRGAWKKPDLSRIRALGYEPRYNLDSALRKIVTYMQANL